MINCLRLLKRICIYIITLLIFTFIFLLAGYDSNKWYGLDEENDKTYMQKFGNRAYFTTMAFSTIGFEKVYPKTPILKALLSIMGIIVITELLTFVFNFKWRSV